MTQSVVRRLAQFLLQISNSQASTFSRRDASEVCHFPRETREAMERREAPGHQRAPLEAGLTYPPRAARRPRAPSDVGRGTSRRSTLATSPSAGRGAPVRPALALSNSGSLLESAPSLD